MAKTIQRTDPHRPGAIIPGHYVCEVDFAAPSTFGGHIIPGFRWNCERDLEVIERDALGKVTKFTPGEHGTHERGLCCVKRYVELNKVARFGVPGKCDVCGAIYKSGSAFRYEPTGEVVLMGHDCADKYECMYDASESELARDRHERALAKVIQREKNTSEREAFLAKHEGLAEAFAVIDTGAEQTAENGAARASYILRDLHAKFVQYRSMSDKQVALAIRLAEQIRNPAPARQEPPKAMAPVTSERIEVEGTIVHTDVREGPYGSSLKMLLCIDTPSGQWKAWGTVPAALERPAAGWKGLRIRVRAKVEVSQKDPSFAFLSRPSLVCVLNLADMSGHDPEPSDTGRSAF